MVQSGEYFGLLPSSRILLKLRYQRYLVLNMKGFVSLSILSLCVAAHATMLNFAGTADNAFEAYVSTDPTAVGASFLSGNSWGTTYSGSTSLTNGVVNYLHVAAFDGGPPMSFIAEVSLSDNSFEFADGSQWTVTGSSNWSGYLDNFGTNANPIDNLGPNGTGPWGTRSGISANASYIWTTERDQSVYFRLTITPVPEPGSFVAIGAGLGLLLIRRRRS